MPFLLHPDGRVHDDRERDEHFGNRQVQLRCRQSKGRQAEDYGGGGEHEVEDVPAAEGLGVISRHAIRPAIGFLQEVERGGDAMTVGAAGEEILPFLVDGRRRLALVPMRAFQASCSGKRQQDRIFQASAKPPLPLVRKLGIESSLGLARRQGQHSFQQLAKAIFVKGPADIGVVAAAGQDIGIEGAPQDTAFDGVDRNMNDRGAALDGELDHFGRAAPAAWRKAVPDSDQYVAVGDGSSAGHDIGFEPVVRVAGQFESAVRRCDKPVVAGAAVFVVEIGEIGRAVEWQDRLQLPAAGQRRLGRHLVGALGERAD